MKCPSCGAELNGKVCEYCGSEWNVRENVSPEIVSSEMQSKFVFLLFGFIFCFPVPLTYLIWKSDKFTEKTKYILIGGLWVAYFGIFIFPFVAPFFMFCF